MTLRNLGKRRLINTIWRRGIGDVGETEITTVLFASNQTFPGITAFSDDLFSILFVLALSAEGKLVFWLSIWDLVDTEPFVGGSEKTRKMTFDVFDIVQLGSQGIIDLDNFRLGLLLFRISSEGDQLTSMTMIFQSVSSSSKSAITPRTLTCLI